MSSALVVSNGGTYGPVRAGDSLWSIAKQLEGNGNLQSLMQKILSANPAAFVDGDMNRLKSGVILTLPGSDDLARTSEESAFNVAQKKAVSKKSSAERPQSPVQLKDPFEEALASNDEPQVTVRAKGRDPVLAARLVELDEKFAAIRAKYSQASTTPTAVEVRSKPVVTLQATFVPKIAEATPTKAKVSLPQTTATSKTGDGVLSIGAAVLFVSGFLLVLAGYIRRRQHVPPTGAVIDAERKAVVAEKVAVRMRLESELRIKLEQQRQAKPASGITVVDSRDRTPSVITSRPATVASVEADTEIDSSIAHGRYVEAEHLLTEVIAQTPRNVSAKMRLAEVYYITERVEEFSALALDLQLNHRADLSSEEWQRLQRMGKIVAPELAMFSGPRAVIRSA
ncbi:MAG: hypothetical protein EXR86_02135 [Gammaproteobacteria bacterium]|nr:hypothetical protein [Gammaproteobacteria bacterium]